MTSKNTVDEWGRQLPNGVIEWQTAEGWVPPFASPEGREMERRTFQAQLDALGVNVPLSIKFFHRTRTMTFSDSEEVFDEEYKVEAEPHPE